MTPSAAERTIVLTMRLLAGAFAVTGILFLATPDGVVSALDDLGDVLGGFATGPETEQKLWLALAFAYMTVIAAIALVVSMDVARYRPLLLVLAAGKVASSLPAGAFFVFDRHVFVYLVTFVVDGTLVGVAIACWLLSGRVGERTGVLR